MRDVTIKKIDDAHVFVLIPGGEVRFARAAIKAIDGKPLEAPALESAQPAAAAPAAVAPGAVNPALAAPVTQEPMSPTAPAPEAATEAAPSAAAAPEAAPAESTAPSAPSVPIEKRFPFEIFLVCFLVFAGLWMRSLQWVQKSLFERREDPRWWTLVALLLPVVGAVLYGVASGLGGLKKNLTSKKQRQQAPAAENPDGHVRKDGMPWMPPPNPAEFLAKQGNTRPGFEFLDTERKSVPVNGHNDGASGLDHSREMLEEAILARASDVHIEPAPDSYRVRFRLDGLMHERMSYDPPTGLRIVTSLKSMAEIDVSEKRKAQDGRFRANVAGRDVDFRVATANSIHGEKMVIRVLDHSSGIFDLTALGMSEAMLETFRSVIQSRNGMILATGPTGSGKTSTLYAALRQLDSGRMNIMTIEDPAEYELAGATQIAVNPKAGITYESGLRSILRQDPDVILVGEMRDREATEVALSAALTGHLVLSSLHTKDAIGTISRLQDMGIERYQVGAAMLLIMAQRLVRVLCPHCRQPYAAQGDELHPIGLGLEPGSTLYAPQGCPECLGTGFRGRTGIFELLVLDEDLRKAVADGLDEATLAAMAEERGFRSYRYDGAEKALLGVTTIDEVLQAA